MNSEGFTETAAEIGSAAPQEGRLISELSTGEIFDKVVCNIFNQQLTFEIF